MINEKRFFSGKIMTYLQKITMIFFLVERQDLILKVHGKEKRQYLMELTVRAILSVKISTSLKFIIKLIINEILVLKVVFC